MRKIGLLAAIFALGGCASQPQADWSVPLELGEDYPHIDVLSIAEVENFAVVPVSNQVYGFDTGAGELAWTVSLEADISHCEPAGVNVLCHTSSPHVYAFDASGNSAEYTKLGVEYSGPAGLYVVRTAEPEFQLLNVDLEIPVNDLDTGDVIAVHDGVTAKLNDGTPIERSAEGTYPEPFQGLVESGVLTQDSLWLNPPAVAHLGQPLIDGHVIIESGAIRPAAVEPTTVTIFDLDGTEIDRRVIDPSLHMSVNSSWSREDFSRIIDRVEKLETDHAFVFSAGEVVGFDRVFSGSIAPAYANVEALEVDTGNRLSFDPIAPESLGLWVVEYPYVSVFGEQVAATFDVTTGEKLIDDAKCQWTQGTTYCFTADELFKIESF